MLIVDAHLDLSYNVLRGRDVTKPAREQPRIDNETATVGLPDLREGNVGLICATIFCPPGKYRSFGYTTAEEARQTAMVQLNWYRQQIEAGLLNFVKTKNDLPSPADEKIAGPQQAIMLMEGADALRSPADVPEWFDYGLRIVGLAWRRTRSAGGTGEPGPLTDEGRALVKAFDDIGIIHDISHLADESFWQLMGLATGPVMASHSNARALVPSDRQISDEMIRAIAARDGVIGLNLYDEFLMPPDHYKTRLCRMDDFLAHVQHMCDLLGSAKQIALGTDLDGGVGREQIPQELTTIADLHRIGEALSARGFSDDDVRGFMGGNWLRFFARTLPDAV